MNPVARALLRAAPRLFSAPWPLQSPGSPAGVRAPRAALAQEITFLIDIARASRNNNVN